MSNSCAKRKVLFTCNYRLNYREKTFQCTIFHIFNTMYHVLFLKMIVYSKLYLKRSNIILKIYFKPKMFGSNYVGKIYNRVEIRGRVSSYVD